MAEMPDVITGEVIASDWGNDIRDRTIQRYVNIAERTALNASPTAGDLAFMEDSGLVYVYYAGAWRAQLPADVELEASTEQPGPFNLPSSEGGIVTLGFTIPSHWLGWRCFALATFAAKSAPGEPTTGIAARLQIAGDNQQQQSALTTGSGTDPNLGTQANIAIGGRRQGITATGATTVILRAARLTTAHQPTISYVFLYARATRTA